jgi:hypothetical protein
MSKQKLTCVHCWIEVELAPKPKTVIGHGADADAKTYRHKTTQDAHGVPFCGKVVLQESDVKWTRAVHE